MWFALSCVAVFLICVIFWFIIVMLCIQSWMLMKAGIVALIGIAVLVWIVAFVYWAVNRFQCRAKLQRELRAAEDSRNIEEQIRLKWRIREETWSDVFLVTLAVWLYIMSFGVCGPMVLWSAFWDWLSCKIAQTKTVCKTR